MKLLGTCIIAALLALVIAALAFCAPAPSRRPPPKEVTPDLTGTWDYTFGRQEYVAYFGNDGVCWAWEQGGNGTVWVGTWELEEHTVTVYEREIDDGEDAVYFAWSVRLKKHGPTYVGRAAIVQFRDLSDPDGRGSDFTIANKR